MQKILFAATLTIAIILLSSLIIPNFGTAQSNSGADDWSMAHHDAANTGFSSSLTPSNPSLLWSFPNPSITNVSIDHVEVDSSPAVANGFVYVDRASKIGGLYCLNAANGDLIWSQTSSTENPCNVALSTSTPTIYNGCLYLADYGLVVLNASTGKLIWSKASMVGLLVLSNGVIYAQSYSCVYAANASTGTLMWNFTNPKGYVGIGVAPAFSEGYVYATVSYGSSSNATGCIFAIDASTGQDKWDFTTATIILSAPAVYQSRLYVGTLNGTVYSIDALTGKLVWSVSPGPVIEGGVITGSPATAYGMVFISSSTNIYGLNASTGAQIWSKPSTSFTFGSFTSPVVADGKIYFQSKYYHLYALNASTGDTLWDYFTLSSSDTNAFGNSGGAGASPVVAFGNIYVGTNEANVMAFGNPHPSSSPSPTVPEFPSWAILSLLMITSVSVTILRKRGKFR